MSQPKLNSNGILKVATFLIGFAAILCACSTNADVDNLKQTFQNPPNTAKSEVYWYFMDGNQDWDEMTADFI